MYAILSGHPNVVGNRERVCDFGQSLTFSQMYSVLKTIRHVLIFYGENASRKVVELSKDPSTLWSTLSH